MSKSKRNAFKSADATFCGLESCTKKKACIRWIGQPEYEEFRNHPRLSMLLIDDEKDCTIYTSINLYNKLLDITKGVW